LPSKSGTSVAFEYAQSKKVEIINVFCDFWCLFYTFITNFFEISGKLKFYKIIDSDVHILI
jgi:hypothetical protein